MVGEHLASVLLIDHGLFVLAIECDNRIEVGAFAGELAESVHVAGDFRLRQQRVELFLPLVGTGEFDGQRGFHS